MLTHARHVVDTRYPEWVLLCLYVKKCCDAKLGMTRCLCVALVG